MNAWRDVGGTEDDSQIGQFLYYMLGAVLYRVQQVMVPTGAHVGSSASAPLLGLYMEEGVVCIHVCLGRHFFLSLDNSSYWHYYPNG